MVSVPGFYTQTLALAAALDLETLTPLTEGVSKSNVDCTKIRQHVRAKIGEEKFKKKVYYNDPAPSISQEEYTSTREIKDISK